VILIAEETAVNTTVVKIVRMPGYIHHIQWCVADLSEAMHKMVNTFGFVQTHHRQGDNDEVVIESGTVRFLLSQPVKEKPATKQSVAVMNGVELKEELENNEANNWKDTEKDELESYPWLRCHCRLIPSSEKDTAHIDSVFNVCLEVDNVDKLFNKMAEHGGQVILPPHTLKPRPLGGCQEQGFVRMAVVGSPCNNVIHSLVNTANFNGSFLPGFTTTQSVHIKSPSLVDKQDEYPLGIDHVTYVCRPGESGHILDWYKMCCGMQRFLVSRQDEPDAGIVLDGAPGLRMKVGSWLAEWLCREEGVEWQAPTTISTNNTNVHNNNRSDSLNFKLVLAEPLVGHPTSHVNSFITAHGGPGLQHIGLLTASITRAVARLGEQGAQFRRPPPTYYTLPAKLQEMADVGAEVALFRQLGILIDEDQAEEHTENDIKKMPRYILQIFSQPLFRQETFFLELIERRGSQGFGAGNIRALAESIILFSRESTTSKECTGAARTLYDASNPSG